MRTDAPILRKRAKAGREGLCEEHVVVRVADSEGDVRKLKGRGRARRPVERRSE